MERVIMHGVIQAVLLFIVCNWAVALLYDALEPDFDMLSYWLFLGSLASLVVAFIGVYVGTHFWKKHLTAKADSSPELPTIFGAVRVAAGIILVDVAMAIVITAIDPTYDLAGFWLTAVIVEVVVALAIGAVLGICYLAYIGEEKRSGRYKKRS
jgi:magnesium-transporting ATPase (P-type)